LSRDGTGRPRGGGPSAVRWRIVALLAALSLVSYALRTNISIAAALMRQDLRLTDIQIGQVFAAFMLGYALFQVPAGVLGDRFGSRLVLTVSVAIWGLATLMTGALPGSIGGPAAAIAILFVVRFLLGVAEAATYPVAAATVGLWMAPSERAFANALVIAGMALGSAVIPPLMSRTMVVSGWRVSFYVTSVLGFAMAALWWWYARDDPSRHPAVNEQERRIIEEGRASQDAAAARTRARLMHWPLLRSRNMLLISASYFLDSYILFIFVFWFYLYLIDERGFSILKGGVYSSLPWIAALVIVPAGGRFCDALSGRFGRRIGRRAVAMIGLLVSALLIALGARSPDPMVAIAALSVSVGFLMATEGSFWSSATDISGAHAATAGGIMNTAGNLGGVVSTALVPVLVARFGWMFALASGSVLGVLAALLWLLIRVDRSADAI
jgi:ACS family glucarate transporter-like MFS transporter